MRVLTIVTIAGLLGACASVPGLSLFAPDEEPTAPASEVADAGIVMASPALRGDAWDGSQFGDVPLPRDFHILFDQSFTHSGEAGLRIADLHYVGEARPEDVVRFFQEEMPAHGWEFERLCGVESKMLTYAKNEENLEVMVADGGVGRTNVAVRLFPR